MYPSVDQQRSSRIYFVLTGLHGLARDRWQSWSWSISSVRARRMWQTELRSSFTNRIETTGLYWHFVDLVWIFLFPSLYLL